MICSIESCESPVIARGWCRKHYLRWYKNGGPTVTKVYKQPTGEDAPAYRHGHWDHPLYKTWRNMISRCYNHDDPSYETYGAKGIKVCRRWREDINAFIADMGARPSGKTLDRINSYGDYEPTNCRWATFTTQGRNRPSFVKLSLAKAQEIRALPRRAPNGGSNGYTRAEIADMYGVSLATVKKVLSGAYWRPDAA